MITLLLIATLAPTATLEHTSGVKLPTVRAANGMVESVAAWTKPMYQKNKALALAVELPLAYHFLTWSHELGHADRVLSQDGQYVFETGQTDGVAYLSRNVLSPAFVFWDPVSGADANMRHAAGFNSTALFAAEADAGVVWQAYARLSTIFYMPGDHSDVEWLSRAYGLSPDFMKSAQLAAAALTWFTPVSADVFFGREDLQLRSRYTHRGVEWGIESPIGKFRPELSVGRKFGSLKITGIISASFAAQVVYQRGRASCGLTYADQQTYFGERVARGSRSLEVFGEFKI